MKQKIYTSSYITKLLDLYFSGRTTLEQENELQHYFTSAHIAPEHLNVAPLFQYIAEEKKKDRKEETHLPPAPGKQQTRWYYIAASAAVLILFFSISTLFLRTHHTGYKLIIEGVEVHDKQLALNFALGKMQKIDKVLEKAEKQTGKAFQSTFIHQNTTINKHLEKIGILEKNR